MWRAGHWRLQGLALASALMWTYAVAMPQDKAAWATASPTDSLPQTLDTDARQRSTLAAMFFEAPAPGPQQKCLPWLVGRGEQCDYVREHPHLCGGVSKGIHYLTLYYCHFGKWCGVYAQIRRPRAM
jgi:hypothetical protein